VADFKSMNDSPKHEMQSLSETHCQNCPVHSDASSMWHTVSESHCIPCLLLVNGAVV